MVSLDTLILMCWLRAFDCEGRRQREVTEWRFQGRFTHSTEVSEMADFPAKSSLVCERHSVESLWSRGCPVRLSGICGNWELRNQDNTYSRNPQ